MPKVLVGAQAPRFTASALSGSPDYTFDSVAGRIVLLFFAGSASWPLVQQSLQAIQERRAIFDDCNACFFGVSIDPGDAAQGRIAQQVPGIRWFLDHDRRVSKLYGASTEVGDERCEYEPQFVLLDHRLRVAATFPARDAGRALDATAALIAGGFETKHAPVLVVPRVLEPSLCRELIAAYDAGGGSESGFMRERDGKTVAMRDDTFKRRRDHLVTDDALKRAVQVRLEQRLLPEILLAFAFEATMIERWLVCCYDAEAGGFFQPHRDNTTSGTAHRVFACTINLNTEEYTGGDLRFPEYGPNDYRAPTGGAIVFSCSLLHEAMPVTSGRRFAFVPFFFDEAREKVRQRNLVHLAA